MKSFSAKLKPICRLQMDFSTEIRVLMRIYLKTYIIKFNRCTCSRWSSCLSVANRQPMIPGSNPGGDVSSIIYLFTYLSLFFFSTGHCESDGFFLRLKSFTYQKISNHFYKNIILRFSIKFSWSSTAINKLQLKDTIKLNIN